MNKKGILLIGHGSKLPFNNMVFQDIREKISAKLNVESQLAYVRLSRPTISESIEKSDAEEIIAQPLMLCEGRVTKMDIPEQLNDNVKLLPTIGADSKLCEVINDRIEKALSKSKLGDVETEIILLTHGSEFEDNEKFLKNIVSMFKSEYPVHYAFFKYNKPSIQEVFENIEAERVVVAPIFVTDGIHTITDIPIILGLAEPPEPCPHMINGKHHPDHIGRHDNDPTHRPQHQDLEIIDYDGEVLLTDSLGDDDRLIELWCKNISEYI